MKKLLILVLHALLVVPVATKTGKWRPTPSYYAGPEMSQELQDLYTAEANMTPEEIAENFRALPMQIALLKEFIVKKEIRFAAFQQEISGLKAYLAALEIYYENFMCEQDGRPFRIN